MIMKNLNHIGTIEIIVKEQETLETNKWNKIEVETKFKKQNINSLALS